MTLLATTPGEGCILPWCPRGVDELVVHVEKTSNPCRRLCLLPVVPRAGVLSQNFAFAFWSFFPMCVPIVHMILFLGPKREV
jgi:hypothetical protein